VGNRTFPALLQRALPADRSRRLVLRPTGNPGRECTAVREPRHGRTNV